MVGYDLHSSLSQPLKHKQILSSLSQEIIFPKLFGNINIKNLKT